MRAIVFRRIWGVGVFALIAFGDIAMGGNQALSDSTDASDSNSGFEHLDIVDTGLKGKLAVLRVGSDRTVNNLLSVFAGLKNKTAHVLVIEVQTIYKDNSGHALSDEKGGWISLKLKPHQETEYHSAALTEDAVDFLVRVRRPSQSDTGGTT